MNLRREVGGAAGSSDLGWRALLGVSCVGIILSLGGMVESCAARERAELAETARGERVEVLVEPCSPRTPSVTMVNYCERTDDGGCLWRSLKVDRSLTDYINEQYPDGVHRVYVEGEL